jgi:hypothetical protein
VFAHLKSRTRSCKEKEEKKEKQFLVNKVEKSLLPLDFLLVVSPSLSLDASFCSQRQRFFFFFANAKTNRRVLSAQECFGNVREKRKHLRLFVCVKQQFLLSFSLEELFLRSFWERGNSTANFSR